MLKVLKKQKSKGKKPKGRKASEERGNNRRRQEVGVN